MSKHIYLLSLFFLLSELVFGQIERSLLWKIEGNGLNAPSYLMGTHHALPPDSKLPIANLEDRIGECKTLVLELDQKKVPKNPFKLIKMMRLPNGDNLKNHMSDRVYGILRSYFVDSLHFKTNEFDNLLDFKPLMLIAAIISKDMPKRTSAEEIIEKIARRKKLRITELEGFKEQLDLFDQIPYSLFFGDDKFSVDEFKNMGNTGKTELYTDYLAQRLDLIELEIESINETEPIFNEIMLKGRNERWAVKLTSLMEKNPCFIAVGAGHLVTSDGLIALLRKMGYNVTPML